MTATDPPWLADPDGATPLTPDEVAGLIPTYIATRADLNAAEQANISTARQWALRSRTARTSIGLLDDAFVRQLHRRMYFQVWRWAGTYRSTERNIGVDPARVAVAVHDLMANATGTLVTNTVPTADEVAGEVLRLGDNPSLPRGLLKFRGGCLDQNRPGVY